MTASSLPDPPTPRSTGEWPEVQPPLTTTPAAGTDVPPPANGLEARIEHLIGELAGRELTIAELSNETNALRSESRAHAEKLNETRGLLEDSQGRVETLEDRLGQRIAHDGPAVSQIQARSAELQDQFNRLVEQHTDLNEVNLQLEAQLAEARHVQEELLRRQAQRAPSSLPDERIAEFHAEMAVARSLLENLESECESKETKIGRLTAEIQALRNIIKHVDAPAIEAAKRRLSGR